MISNVLFHFFKSDFSFGLLVLSQFFFDMSNWCGSERFVIFSISIMMRNSHVDSMAKHLIKFNEFASSFCLMFKSIVLQTLAFIAGTQNTNTNFLPSVPSQHFYFVMIFFFIFHNSICRLSIHIAQQANFTFINFSKLFEVFSRIVD